MTTVVIGEDDLLVREGLLSLLAPVRDVEVLEACGDRGALDAAIDRWSPDVVVTDIRMPPTFRDEGLEIARRMRWSVRASGWSYSAPTPSPPTR